jgi:hypothetical protein
MGVYLATGIAERVFVSKRRLDPKIELKTLTAALQEELNLDHYLFSESEDLFLWKIKPKLLEGNFLEFLETQFRLYGRLEDKDTQETLAELRKAKTGEEVIAIAETRDFLGFRTLDYVDDCIRVQVTDRFSSPVEVKYHLMTFFFDGKILMECYANILRYFERSIRLQEATYPVVGCLKIRMAG